MDVYSGARVKLQMKDKDIVFGFINSINTNEDESIVALSKVEIWQNGLSSKKTRIPGIQRIQGSEIEDIEILPESQTSQNKTDKEKKLKGKNIQYNKRIPTHLHDLIELDPEKLIFGRSGSGSNEDLINTVFKENGKSSDYDSSSDVEDSYSTEDFTVLTKTDKLFHETIKFISEKSVVGMAGEGIDIGRNGKLCWIQIEASGAIFLFDMLRLGTAGLEYLKNIIQSSSILKVIHDCRLLSDLFYHQYKIQMINIFDTQVAHVLAYREQNHKDLPRYVPGLASCLYEHLDLPNEQIHIMRIREQAKSEDQEIWAKRPAAAWLLEAASKHVKHLPDLRIVLMEKMMVEFIAGVEIYLTYVRNSSDKEALDCQSKRHLLPLAFKHLHNFVSDLQRRMKHNYGGKSIQRSKDEHGFRENRILVTDPKIIVSKDSIWHANINSSAVVNRKGKVPPADIKVKSSKNDLRVFDQEKETRSKYVDNSETDQQQNQKLSENNMMITSPSNISDMEDGQLAVTEMFDSSFLEKLNSSTSTKCIIPTSKKLFSTMRSDLSDSPDKLKGIRLRPAGRMENQLPKKKSEELQYNQHFPVPARQCDVSEDDTIDYGEIPTPQTLGRAAVRTTPKSLFASMSTEELMSSSIKSPMTTSDDSSVVSNNSCSEDVFPNFFVVPKQVSSNQNKSKINNIQQTLNRLHNSSDSNSTNEQSVRSSRLQQLCNILKVQQTT